jgi:tetratricopeptide (TPR) repeat protein
MRILGSRVVLVLVLMAGTARAEQAPPLTPDQAAAVVVRLWEAKDQAALAVVAAKDDPDPWFVADALLLLEKREAAAAFAAAAPRKDVEGLPAFVTGWRAGPAEVAARKALSDGNALLQAKKPAEALPLFAGVSADAMSFLKARAEFGEGIALAGQGKGPESTARYAAAAERLEGLGWLNRAAMAWLSCARAVNKVDLAKAIAPLQRLLAVQRRRENRPGIAGAYDVLGRAHTELKQWNEAAEAHTKALEILTELADPAYMAVTLNLIGNAVVRAYRAKEAHAAADKALAIAQPGGLQLEVARAHEVHGMAHSLEGHPRQAQASYEAGVAPAEASGDESLVARMLHGSGVAWAECEEHTRALEPLRKSLEVFERLDEGKSPRVTLARAHSSKRPSASPRRTTATARASRGGPRARSRASKDVPTRRRRRWGRRRRISRPRASTTRRSACWPSSPRCSVRRARRPRPAGPPKQRWSGRGRSSSRCRWAPRWP